MADTTSTTLYYVWLIFTKADSVPFALWGYTTQSSEWIIMKKTRRHLKDNRCQPWNCYKVGRLACLTCLPQAQRSVMTLFWFGTEDSLWCALTIASRVVQAALSTNAESGRVYTGSNSTADWITRPAKPATQATTSKPQPQGPSARNLPDLSPTPHLKRLIWSPTDAMLNTADARCKQR